ncbi:hypothetical protein [Marinobacter daepoensis]|uniref:hypothetical protein n=1 Tax=Marinobacter daepoensis TaxID=262077 RepID=UPI00040A3BF0|nr:hypothetical protein [Marinobacter daepoensis]
MDLPLELEFLAHHFEAPSSLYRQAEWLTGDFEADVWRYSFDFKNQKELDWRVELSDASLLTDPENAVLLDSFKYWLIASTHPYENSGAANGLKSQYAAFNRTMHLIDYLLLNDERFQLYRYGLEGLSEDDIKGILSQLLRSNDVFEALFDWPAKLVEFAQDLMHKTDPIDMNKALRLSPGMSIVTAEDELEAKSFGIDPETLPNLRAALKAHGFIAQNRALGRAPKSAAISEQIYKRSIRMRYSTKPAAVTCLAYSSITDRHVREYDPVSVTTGSKKAVTSGTLALYRASIYKLGVLHEIGLPAPSVESLVAAHQFTHPNPEPHGRYRTLPSEEVFSSVKNAIEFHFEHGRKILNGYLRVVLAAKLRDCTISSLTPAEFQGAIGTRETLNKSPKSAIIRPSSTA